MPRSMHFCFRAARYQLDHPAASQNWLGDKRSEVARALPVYQIESVVELLVNHACWTH